MKAGKLKKGDGKGKERLSQKICATKPIVPHFPMEFSSKTTTSEQQVASQKQ